MSNTVYQMSGHPGILRHFLPVVEPLVRDEAEDEAELLRRARIRSGDYLMTLATELEQITDSLTEAHAPEAPELERIVSELLFIDRNYKIVER